MRQQCQQRQRRDNEHDERKNPKSGNEHDEDGHISEEIQDRNKMVEKRARKHVGMLSDMLPPQLSHKEAKTLLVGWGSTRGVIEEAACLLRDEGVDAGSLHFCDLWPFPARTAAKILDNADHIYVIEQNSTGQFAQLLRQETGISPSETILKYDGRPFYPVEIKNSVKEKMG